MSSFQFSSLDAIGGLHHAITPRHEGFSRAEYSSLNLAFHVGDEDTDVQRNRQLIAQSLGYSADLLVAAQQVHGTEAQVVTREYAGRGALDWQSAVPDCDALVVAEPQIPVMILVADCAPILLVDPVLRVLAVVHAGWRGAVASICSKTLQQMQKQFGTEAGTVFAGIGPCLCADCFDVGDEVAAQAPSTCVVSGYGKPHLDLRKVTQSDLTGAGVLASHIETMARCPRCDNETFFSHRGQNGKAGRFGLVAWWQE